MMNDENIPTTETLAESPNRRRIILALSGIVIVGICALFLLSFLWFQPDQTALFSIIFPSPTSTLTSTPTNLPPTLTQITTADLTATQRAWIKPKESPSLASAEDARKAYDSGGGYLYLEDLASVKPYMPSINQPGDAYIFEIQLSNSEPLLWWYAWCTITKEILEENFKHIQLEFTVNEVPASLVNFTVIDFQNGDNTPCRAHVALVNKWPEGQHQLETRVTFTQDINDGWYFYSAGTHIYKYVVTVHP